MASKRKFSDAPEDLAAGSVSPSAPSKVAKSDETKSASTAAAAAAAIAAKIAAQFSGGGGGSTPHSSGGGGEGGGGKDPFDAEFTHDIDINDVRNRYMLTKGSTQSQIHEETGASVSTKGVWYPDRTKANEKDPPLYLHIAATTQEILQKAIDKVNDLLNIDMGSLVEDKKDVRRERRKWPEEKIPVGLESIRNFNVRAKVVGPTGMFVKYIQQETGTRVQIKGIGSGFVDQETGRESDEPMHIHITGPDEGQVARAKVLTEDLLEVVRAEHAKVKAQVYQQQMELHQAQAQYAAYSAYAGYVPPPPSAPAPPPPPGEQPPPPPPDASSAAMLASSVSPPSATTPAAPPAATDTEAFKAYWAAFGYDVDSQQFKDWQASQQQQYAQYYGQQQVTSGYGTPGNSASQSQGQAGGAPAPPPSEPAPPPPPPA